MLILIGDDRREATDWLQDRLVTTRPLAEKAMIALMKEGSVITKNEGIFLVEAEEETEQKAKKIVNHISKKSAYYHKKSIGKKITKNLKGRKIIKTDYSHEADQMIQLDDDDKGDS